MTRYGHNVGYIDEIYRRYCSDPASVSEAWQEFFRDYRPEGLTAVAPSGSAAGAVVDRPPADRTPEAEAPPEGALELRGAPARIVENMTSSLAVPTATSARSIAVKMLEENRRVINTHQTTSSGPKVSFTHLIAWAVVRALQAHPAMNVRYVEAGGRPHVLPRAEIHLGLAIDLEKNGQRTLLVPNVRNAAALDFPSFVGAYNDLVARSREGKLTVDDFQGTTVTLTNPGMLGTAMSVPRLMQGQGTIIGVGSIGYPAEYSGMAPEMISELGISKVMTVTSTYDHRVIQGAESGSFLKTIEGLLQGDRDFFRSIFAELGVPQEPLEFAGDRNPPLGGGAGSHEAIAKQAGVLQLIRAYRVRGHLWADLDPLHYRPEPTPELELATYGLSVWDLDRTFIAGGLAGQHGTMKLRQILEILQRTYCWRIGVEFMHIQDSEPRHWLQEAIEPASFHEPPSRDEQMRILGKLNVAEAFETFLHTNYIGQKRFSLEGAETLIPMLDVLIEDASEAGVEQVVMGMAHRGRLNVLAHVVGKPYGQIFGEFEGIDPSTTHGSGDVKYHLGATGRYATRGGREVEVVLASNPSHLEAVDPVVQGMARARQDRLQDDERRRVLPLLIHGDASFAGQGVVAETLNLSWLSGYRTGGTIHVIVNNQIGFTTGPTDARSSHYPTDVAKMVRAPIFHVNGDHPEEAVRVTRLAVAYRQAFKRDVVIDLFCYRRWGHNEADDPSYTHPILYSRIESHRSVRKRYTEQLLRRGDLSIETAEKALEDYRARLQQVHDEVREATGTDGDDEAVPAAPHEDPMFDPLERVETGAPMAALERVLAGLDRVPEGFTIHPKLARQLARRGQRFASGQIDWALAEALAFGTLVLEGTPVRLSGEDSGRGTFSQRHAALHDYESAERHVPLAHLSEDQAAFHVYDSLLSEFAVLGFDYGYSVDMPEGLVLWEAQFGDFVNGAQVILDQFLSSAESKWGQRSGLVLLLPHGYEGQGPEHSSARLERFLQLCAGHNMRVAYPSTPGQYFHLLRRQVALTRRKPLVVMTPKSLLRLPACVSTAEELTRGTFEELLPGDVEPATVRRLVFCSGKVYWDLRAAQESQPREGVSLVRVEQLYPFPGDALAELLRAHANALEVVWVQEEPANMGPWAFVEPRLRSRLVEGQELVYVGRSTSASPATGSARRHKAEQERIVRKALEGGDV